MLEAVGATDDPIEGGRTDEIADGTVVKEIADVTVVKEGVTVIGKADVDSGGMFPEYLNLFKPGSESSLIFVWLVEVINDRFEGEDTAQGVLGDMQDNTEDDDGQ